MTRAKLSFIERSRKARIYIIIFRREKVRQKKTDIRCVDSWFGVALPLLPLPPTIRTCRSCLDAGRRRPLYAGRWDQFHRAKRGQARLSNPRVFETNTCEALTVEPLFQYPDKLFRKVAAMTERGQLATEAQRNDMDILVGRLEELKAGGELGTFEDENMVSACSLT